ncbi:hypothetical protein ACVWW6_000521 [Bradyrhizobium sp. USDA 3311]|uniref:hypothetical protein n=1 Tax=Bradyrhizobium sp. LCT2 TaxID=2493093 RepID=UPI00192A3EB8|nr:hypothetical protein [Bradyrhizobium sp. LCT2]
MSVELETWRTSGECCTYGTALGALTLEMIGNKFEWAPGSSSAARIVQLSASTWVCRGDNDLLAEARLRH